MFDGWFQTLSVLSLPRVTTATYLTDRVLIRVHEASLFVSIAHLEQVMFPHMLTCQHKLPPSSSTVTLVGTISNLSCYPCVWKQCPSLLLDLRSDALPEYL